MQLLDRLFPLPLTSPIRTLEIEEAANLQDSRRAIAVRIVRACAAVLSGSLGGF
jgi:hypothetical protein